MSKTKPPRIDEKSIWASLEEARNTSTGKVKEILDKAKEMKGLSMTEVALLTEISDPDLMAELFETAQFVKEEIYGRRLVIFAPLYVSNLCKNDCTYCAFRAKNKDIDRRALSSDEIAIETRALIEQGHKRVLLVAGESYPQRGFEYVLDAIDTIYETKTDLGEIRRINVNVAPLTTDEFKRLGERKIGTYQIFQETYHKETYSQVHIRGKKTDYQWRIEAIDRAMRAGINDVGIGVLFGLFDWRYELLAMMSHTAHLESQFGVGPHTISVPRLEPANGSTLASHPPNPVSDVQFRKLVAILRIAVPYTGIIMSTRESAHIRRETFALGVSQISAGSRTNPGGYGNEPSDKVADQFSLGDHRSLDEVVRDVAELGYLPSFCTGCYRLGRTGQNFMDLACPGDIKKHCDPNGVSSFTEYLKFFASEETKRNGHICIEKTLKSMSTGPRGVAKAMMTEVQNGSRDVYC